MAAGAHGKKYTFAGTSPVSLTAASGRANEFFLANLGLRAPRANVGNVYVVAEGEEVGLLYPGDALGVELTNRWFGSSQVSIKGSVADVLHILWFD